MCSVKRQVSFTLMHQMQIHLLVCVVVTGGVLGFDNCAYPDDAWQQQYCLTGPKIGAGLRNMSTIMNGQQGAVSMADYLKVSALPMH